VNLTIRWADPGEYPGLPSPERGTIAIYWAEETVTREPRGKSQRLMPMKKRDWRMAAFLFSPLRNNQRNDPPINEDEAMSMILRAYALAASHHPIPSDALVLYAVTP